MYIYETVINEIKRAIEVGQLVAGSRIPSIREYANAHSISINSVKRAYQYLEDSGLISARPQSGYFVCDKLPPLNTAHTMTDSKSVIPLSGINNIMSIILDAQKKGDYIDLAMACPVGKNFYPLNRLKKITIQTIRSGKTFRPEYNISSGSKKLCSQITRRGLLFGMTLDPDDILVTHGAMEALNLAIRACTNSGDAVAVETPTFFNIYPMLENLGRKIVSIPTHPVEGICLDMLEQHIIENKVSALITIPSAHNPLGFIMPIEARQRLAAMANKYKFTVIEDAMYAELQFNQTLVPNIKAFDKNGWVMICASYTKTIAPDFRIGWLEAGRFRDIVRQLKFNTSVSESKLLSETLGTFLENGSYDQHLRHLRRLYAKQIDVIKSCVSLSFPVGTRTSSPKGGFILWLELPKGTDTIAIFHEALKEKIVCMPGVICSGNKSFNHHLRIPACFELTEEYLNGIKRLGQIASQFVPK